MSFNLYTKKEFIKIMGTPIDSEGNNNSYFCRDIENLWEGRDNILFGSVEGSTTEKERFAYDVIESIIEGKEANKVITSNLGEETYYVYSLDKKERNTLNDTPVLESIKGKSFLLIEVVIPGMVDYCFLF